jgi:hypothetical protein
MDFIVGLPRTQAEYD